MRVSTIVFCLIIPISVLTAQQVPGISNETDFHALTRQAESYFADNGTGKGSGYKQYMRWRWHMDYRVGPDGVMQNYDALNYEAYRKIQKDLDQSRSSHGSWEDLGPSDYSVSDSYSGGGIGRVNCIAFHPTDPDIFWIGAPAGGLWKTTDGGTSWAAITDGFASIAISGIAVNPNTPSIIYILTGDGDGADLRSIGVLMTTDGGNTWKQTGLSWGVSQGAVGFKLVMHPTNSQILLAATNLGIWKTINGGASWTQTSTARTTDIEFAPSDPGIMYAVTTNIIDQNWGQARFIKSVDTGSTWSDEWDASFPDTSSRCAIAISPSSPANVYLVFGGSTATPGTFRGLYKSTNYGASFTQRSTSPNILSGDTQGGGNSDQAWYDLTIIADPTNDNVIYVGGINLWKSTDGGVLWDRQTWWLRDDVQPYVHADWHALEFQGNVLFSGVDGGIYKSADGGGSWTELSSGLSIMQFYEIDVHNGVYMGGTQDNGTNEAAVTNQQSHNILGGDGFGCTWHSGNDQIQYLSSQSRIVRRQFGSNIIIWEVGDGFWFTDIKMHKTNTNYLFLDRGSELFRGNENFPWDYYWDSLKTSTLLFIPNTNSSILGFAQGTDDPEVMYVVNRAKIIKTTDLSAGDPVWDTLPNPVFGIVPLSDIIVDPDNADRVWLTCGGYNAAHKIYYSDTGGESWENITGSLPNVPVRCITYHTGTSDHIYLGTEIGVFFKNSLMSDWVYFSNYLPNTIVSDIVISGSYVYAGTFGRGIWRSETYSSCPVNLVLTPANDGNPISTGTQVYHALSTITSTRILSGGLGTEVFYNAGNYIDVTPGFWAKSENFLEVKIEGCPD